ncbi:MAG: hypothetical protein RLZZ424_1598, partial [Bacteroidota bacterium]
LICQEEHFTQVLNMNYKEKIKSNKS